MFLASLTSLVAFSNCSPPQDNFPKFPETKVFLSPSLTCFKGTYWAALGQNQIGSDVDIKVQNDSFETTIDGRQTIFGAGGALRIGPIETWMSVQKFHSKFDDSNLEGHYVFAGFQSKFSDFVSVDSSLVFNSTLSNYSRNSLNLNFKNTFVYPVLQLNLATDVGNFVATIEPEQSAKTSDIQDNTKFVETHFKPKSISVGYSIKPSNDSHVSVLSSYHFVPKSFQDSAVSDSVKRFIESQIIYDLEFIPKCSFFASAGYSGFYPSFARIQSFGGDYGDTWFGRLGFGIRFLKTSQARLYFSSKTSQATLNDEAKNEKIEFKSNNTNAGILVQQFVF